MNRLLTAGLSAALWAALPVLATPQCPEWSTEFTAPGVDGIVYALLAHDDGTGERLYVGGEFSAVGDVPARNIAVWDGMDWSAVGGGLPDPVRTLAFYDDGNGGALYAGGGPGYPGMFERYDGSRWTSIPVARGVGALHVHDDGNGEALFAGGDFLSVAGVEARGLARYDGSWSALGGTRGQVRALATHDDGTGSKLYAAGSVWSEDDPSIEGILSWDGATIAPVGPAGVPSGDYGNEGPFALESFEGDLYVGGYFEQAGGLASQNWARWTSNGWEALPPSTGIVRDFVVRTAGDGTRSLFVAGWEVMRWGPGGLTAVGSGTYLPHAIEVLDEGQGERLFVGHFGSPNSLLRWEGGQWSQLLEDGLGPRGSIRKLASRDLGSGPRLVAGGSMILPGAVEQVSVASFDGSTWTSMSANLTPTSGSVYDIEVHDDGSGPTLHAAGHNLDVDGTNTLVARFNGTDWETLAAGGSWGYDLETFGEGLILGGNFFNVDGVPGTRYIARWDGAQWSSLGGGLDFSGFSGDRVHKMAVYDAGGGEELYIGGRFSLNGSNHEPISVARWDGQVWSTVGLGIEGGYVLDLTVFQSPQGEVLVAVGTFDTAGGAPVPGIAAWDGTSWSTFGSGPAGNSLQGWTVGAFDPDGNGEQLYLCSYEPADGSTASRYRLDVWDGTSWAEPLVVEERFEGFLEHDDGGGRALYTFGSFKTVDGVPSVGIARFADACGADVGVPTCTALENSAGLRGRTRADGSSSVAAEDLTLSARDLPPGASTLFFHGAAPRRIPFGEGLRCVGGPLQRIYPVGQATGGAYELSVDFSAPYAADFAAGTTLLFQGWYRDGMGGPAGFNTTDALELAFRP